MIYPISQLPLLSKTLKSVTLINGIVKCTAFFVGASSIALLTGKPATAVGLQFSGELGGFSNPRSTAVDRSNGNVYVLDANRISSYSSSGVLLNSFTGSFASATGLAIDSSSNIYVADADLGQIFKFDTSGVSLASIGKGFGNGNGYFSGNLGVAVDNSGNIYVGDAGDSQIEKFDINGQFLASIGQGFGSGNGYFSGDLGVAVDNTGNIYVADGGDAQIEKFDTNGAFLASIGNGRGYGDGQFLNLNGVAVDSNGRIYATDGGANSRVQEFAADGTFLSSFGNGYGNGEIINPEFESGLAALSAPNNAASTNQTQLNFPQGLAVNNGIIYVADTNNNRIAVLSANAAAQAVPEPSEMLGTILAGGAALAMRHRYRRRQQQQEMENTNPMLGEEDSQS
jgi:sugar lactone lactonase YvrE